MKIITSHNHPPIPDRSMDWSAVFEDYDGGDIEPGVPSRDPIGYGPTEQAAIEDLLGRYEECPKCGEVETYYWLKSSGWCAKCDFRWGRKSDTGTSAASEAAAK